MIPVIEFDKNNDIYESKCIDDYKWRKGTKTCRDYSIFGSNCNDIGEDGRTADEACKVACDNCSIYKNIEFLEKENTIDSRDILYKINTLEQKLKDVLNDTYILNKLSPIIERNDQRSGDTAPAPAPAPSPSPSPSPSPEPEPRLRTIVQHQIQCHQDII